MSTSLCSCGDQSPKQRIVGSLSGEQLSYYLRSRQGQKPFKVHLLCEGGVIVTYLTEESKTEFTIHFEGSIGIVTFKGDLHVNLDLPNNELRITLELSEPLPFKHTWVVHLLGVSDLGKGAWSVESTAIGANSLEAYQNGPILCMLACGGKTAIKIGLKCLPSLIIGTEAFMACAIANFGEGAAEIAACIADKCLS